MNRRFQKGLLFSFGHHRELILRLRLLTSLRMTEFENDKVIGNRLDKSHH
jgi:hypothetical protein